MARPLPTVGGAMSRNQTGFGCPMGHAPAPAPTAGRPPAPSLPPRPATFLHVVLCAASTRSPPPALPPLFASTCVASALHHPPSSTIGFVDSTRAASTHPACTYVASPASIPRCPHPRRLLPRRHPHFLHTSLPPPSRPSRPHHRVSPLTWRTHTRTSTTQPTATLHLHRRCRSSLAHRHHRQPPLASCPSP